MSAREIHPVQTVVNGTVNLIVVHMSMMIEVQPKYEDKFYFTRHYSAE